MKLLVCDDDPVIRYLLEVVLAKRGGHDVISTGEAADVAETARRERPDGVLLDYMMPGLSGLDVAGELAADPLTAAIPVVFLTGRADLDEDDFRDLNIAGVIEKPFETATLAERVRVLISRDSRER